jgi:hypothetical protein
MSVFLTYKKEHFNAGRTLAGMVKHCFIANEVIESGRTVAELMIRAYQNLTLDGFKEEARRVLKTLQDRKIIGMLRGCFALHHI